MEGWLRDVALAIRGLRREPAFAVTAILTLALAIGANTAVFSVLHGAILAPLSYPEPDRLVFITSQFAARGVEQSPVSPAEFVELRAHTCPGARARVTCST